MSFISNLISEVLKNGKTSLGVFISQVPGLTSVPGIKTAFITAVTDRTYSSYFDLAAQVLMLVGASLQAKKVVVNAADKS